MDLFRNFRNALLRERRAPENRASVGLQLEPGYLGGVRENLRKSMVRKRCATQVSNAATHRSVVDTVAWILNAPAFDANVLTDKLVHLHQQFYGVFESADIARPLRTRRYICATGLVTSPEHCTETIKDANRVFAFVRGVHAALQQLRHRFVGKLHIVYPACGPFAPLLLPLLSYYQQRGLYTEEELGVTLIDIQEGAILSLQKLVQHLQLQPYIVDLCCANAVDYQNKGPVHMVLLEALQHGFSREGHLQIAKHFASLLEPNGIFLPQIIRIGAALSVGQREFVEQWRRMSEQERARIALKIQSERTEMGEILRVDLPLLRQMSDQQQDEYTQLFECNTLVIPPLRDLPDRQLLIIHSRISVFAGNDIIEYESGITHPLPDFQVCVNSTACDPHPGDLLVRGGDQLQFYYCMNGLPGFLPIKLDKRVPVETETSVEARCFENYSNA